MTSPKAPRPLTDKQKLFVAHYLETKNATEAAIYAGYSLDNADKIGSELLGKTRVKAEIDAALERLAARAVARAELKGITKERCLAKLASIAFANSRDFFEVTERGVRLVRTEERSRAKDRAIKKINESTSQHGGSQSLELHDPLKALELIMKHYGWLVDKQELSGPGGKPISLKAIREDLTPEEVQIRLLELQAKVRAV